MSTPVFEKSFQFHKDAIDYEQGIAFGFAIVSKENGVDYWDLQGDHIPEDVMKSAALEFMASVRVGSDQHTGEHVGDIVFGTPVTTGSALAYSSNGVMKTGLWIGYKPQDPVHLDMIASGERTGFSIGGILLDSLETEIGKAVWSTAFVNNLPDSSFLYVKAGGKKDSEGKTEPRTLRMFPVKGTDGSIDLAHLRNAIARIPQANIPSDKKTSLQAKAKAMLASVEKSIEKGAYGSPDKKKGRVFRAFKIHEISLVTRPAQEGATVEKKQVIATAPIRKEVVLTSSDSGHQHALCIDYLSDDDYVCTTWEYSTGADKNGGDTHSHRVYLKDGQIVIADNAGHGHTIEAPEGWQPPVREADETPNQPGVTTIEASAPEAKSAKGGLTVEVDIDTTEANRKLDELAAKAVDVAAKTGNLLSTNAPGSVAKEEGHQEIKMPITEAELEILKARAARMEAAEATAARATKIAELTDGQKVYFGKLTAPDQSIFLAKSTIERQVEVDQAAIYKTADGTLFFKNDDPRMVQIVKDNETLTKSLAKAEQARKDAECATFAKSVIPALAGDDATKVLVAQFVAGIEDDKLKKSVVEMLTAANAAAGFLTQAQGHNRVEKHDDPATPEGAFYKGLEDWAKTNNVAMNTEIAKAKATRDFTHTPEGRALYAATQRKN